jgi:hypothetical protein
VALLFAQFFGASCDSLEHFVYLALLLGRDILKCTFDESGVLAEDRNEYSASLFRKRNSANAAIALALHTCRGPDQACIGAQFGGDDGKASCPDSGHYV